MKVFRISGRDFLVDGVHCVGVVAASMKVFRISGRDTRFNGPYVST